MKTRSARLVFDRLCDFVRVPDGLPEFVSKGIWTARKLYFLCEYLDQTTRAMKARRGFPGGLSYVDLFCGAGVSVVDDGENPSRRFPGSALIAAAMPNHFDRLVLVDKSGDSLRAACARITRLGSKSCVVAIEGDSNDRVDDVLAALPEHALNVAFVDPYSLDVHFETIRRLAERRPLDLIILFSDRFDLGRNVHATYYPAAEESKLDRFLGESNWKQQLDALPDHSGPAIRQFFADRYLKHLHAIGYRHSRSWPIDGPAGPAFRLVFASKNSLGLKFCAIALAEDYDGNRGLWGAM